VGKEVIGRLVHDHLAAGNVVYGVDPLLNVAS